MKVTKQSGRTRAVWSAAVVGLVSLSATAIAPFASASTASAPVVVKTFDAAPVSFLALDGQLVFSTNGSEPELWRSDGTDTGTTLIADIRPNDIDFGGRSIVSGGSLYLAADDGATGVELWRTDGVTAEPAADLCPGSCSSFPTGLTEFDGQLYFNAFSTADGAVGRQLHRYDPATESFSKVLGIPDPSELTVLTDHLYLVAGQTLQRTDGVSVESAPVPEGWSRPQDLVRLGSSLFFAMRDGNGNEQVFRTDGSATVQITTIEALADRETSVRRLDAVGGKLYLTVDQGDGTKLWVTDGTVGGAQKLEVFESGVSRGPLAAWKFAEVGGHVYFNGFNSQTGSQLWRTDGTVAGTRIVEDLGRVRVGTQSGQPTYNDPAPDWLTPFGDRLYFSAYVGAEADTHGEGRHLFRTTVTGDGVEFVAEFGQFQQPRSLTVVGEALLFSAAGALWRIGSTGSDSDDSGDPGDGPTDPGDDADDDTDDGTPGDPGDPVTVIVSEAITVSDEVRAAGPAQLVVTEQITVVDTERAAGPAMLTVPESVVIGDASTFGPDAPDGGDPTPGPPVDAEVVGDCTLFVLGAEVSCEVGGLEANQLVQVLVVVNPTLFEALVLTGPDGVARFAFRIPDDLPPGSVITTTIRALDGRLLYASRSPAVPASERAPDPREADTANPSRPGPPLAGAERDDRDGRNDPDARIERVRDSSAAGTGPSPVDHELSRTGGSLLVLTTAGGLLFGAGLRLRRHDRPGRRTHMAGPYEPPARRRP